MQAVVTKKTLQKDEKNRQLRAGRQTSLLCRMLPKQIDNNAKLI